MQLTFRDILRAFEVPEKTVRGWIEREALPCIRVNEQDRFSYISVLEWALEHHVRLTPQLMDLGQADHQGQILSSALKKGEVHYDLAGNTREEVLSAVVSVLPLAQGMDRGRLFKMLLTREKMGSTAIGGGIAIPHVRNPIVLHIDEPVVMACFLKNPIDFMALDNKPVNILFTVLSPSVKVHLALLARLAYCLQDKKMRGQLLHRAPREEILAGFLVTESRLEQS